MAISNNIKSIIVLVVALLLFIFLFINFRNDYLRIENAYKEFKQTTNK